MADPSIRRRLDAIIALQLLLLALALPGGSAIALLIGAALALYVIFFGTISFLAREPSED